MGLAATLRRLCLAVTLDLDVAGATVTVTPDLGRLTVAAASTPEMARAEDAQLDTGQGPTRDACDRCEPVLVTNPGSLVARWPGYAPAALATGVSAVFALPLHVGAARLGALTLYWHRPRHPATGDLRVALVFADLATEFLIDGSCSAAGNRLDPALVAALDTHGHIYEAQGMVMVDLGVGLSEALAWMRTQALSTGQDLAVLASRIIDGETVVVRDRTRHPSREPTTT